MTIEIRPALPSEMDQMGRIASYVYAGSYGDGQDNTISRSNRPEWTLCGFDGDRMVASYSTIPFTMRANGKAMALGGVSAVGTLPEYRRQGLARRLTTLSLADMYERGQPVAALWASQAAIYQRYGYAQATVNRSYAIDSVDIGFFDGDPGRGDVRRVDIEEGYDLIKAIYIAFITNRLCYLHRARALWDNNALADVAEDGPAHLAVSYDEDGRPNGYAVYTLRSGKVDHASRSQEVVVRDLAWLTTDAYRSLWSWFACHDLVGRVRWNTAPVDDPAPELLIEPRLLHTSDVEGLWLRVVNVEAALAGRGYDNDGAISIKIMADDLAPWNTGAYTLTVDGGEAEVKGAPGGAELTMSIKALASLFSGFRSARRLWAWGLIEGTPDAIVRADHLFATSTGPGCPDQF